VKDSNKIETNSKVAIIGGGPAGSFFTLYLLHYASRGVSTPKSLFTSSAISMNQAQEGARAALVSSLCLYSGI